MAKLRVIWKEVAAQRMGEPVVGGVWVRPKGAAAKGMVSSAGGQLLGAVNPLRGALGSIVEGAVERVIEAGGQAVKREPATSFLPIKEYAYIAVGSSKVGLFTFDAKHHGMRDAIQKPLLIVERTPGMSIKVGRRSLLWEKATITIPGYLPTPFIYPVGLRSELKVMAKELNGS